MLEPTPGALLNAEYLSTSAFLEQAESLIEFRKVLELGLVALAAEKSNEDDWTAMRAILAEQEAALRIDRRTRDGKMMFYEAINSANLRFHKALAAATRNPLAIMVLEAISAPLTEVSRRTNEMPGVPEAGVRQHLAIYRAIREKNPEKARRAMHVHLAAAERNAHILEEAEHEVGLKPAVLPPPSKKQSTALQR